MGYLYPYLYRNGSYSYIRLNYENPEVDLLILYPPRGLQAATPTIRAAERNPATIRAGLSAPGLFCLEDSWGLSATDNWAKNATSSLPNWPYISYPYFK